MIHHTSGIRDQWELLALSNWRMDDVITTADILGLMARQRELNFAPVRHTTVVSATIINNSYVVTHVVTVAKRW